MTEDLDKELQDMMGDTEGAGDDIGLDDFDLGDLDSSAGGEDDMGGLGDADDMGGLGDADEAGDIDLDALSGLGNADDVDAMDTGIDAADSASPEPDAAPTPQAAAAPGPMVGQSAPARRPDGLPGEAVNLAYLLDIKLNVTFEVGRAKMVVTDLLTLGQGSVIELHRLVGDELDFMVNGRLVAKGQVVVVNEKFGCKITSIVPPEERIKYMAGW